MKRVKRRDPIDPDSPRLVDVARKYREAVIRADWHAFHGTLTPEDAKAVEAARRAFTERVMALP